MNDRIGGVRAKGNIGPCVLNARGKWRKVGKGLADGGLQGYQCRCIPGLPLAQFTAMHQFTVCFALLFGASICLGQNQTNPITREMVEDAQKLIGLDFSQSKIDLLVPDLKGQLENFEVIRRFPLSNGVPPAISFNPIPVGMKIETRHRKAKFSSPRKAKLLGNLDELAFYSIGQLAALI